MTPEDVFAVMEATWPPAASHRLGPWRLRDGAGGGKRVSATTAEGDWTDQDIALAEQAGSRLFMIRPQDTALDAALAARGYHIIDPVITYAAPVARFAPPPRMTTFAHGPPCT